MPRPRYALARPVKVKKPAGKRLRARSYELRYCRRRLDLIRPSYSQNASSSTRSARANREIPANQRSAARPAFPHRPSPWLFMNRNRRLGIGLVKASIQFENPARPREVRRGLRQLAGRQIFASAKANTSRQFDSASRTIRGSDDRTRLPEDDLLARSSWSRRRAMPG